MFYSLENREVSMQGELYQPLVNGYRLGDPNLRSLDSANSTSQAPD